MAKPHDGKPVRTPRQSKPSIDFTCDVCANPARASFLAALEAGATIDEIAGGSGLAPGVLQRHFTECIPQIPDHGGDVSAASDAELAALIVHSEELYCASVLSNNLSAASSSLTVRLRALAERERRTELRDERKAMIEGASPLDRSTWGEALHKFMAAYIDGCLSRVREESIE